MLAVAVIVAALLSALVETGSMMRQRVLLSGRLRRRATAPSPGTARHSHRAVERLTGDLTVLLRDAGAPVTLTARSASFVAAAVFCVDALALLVVGWAAALLMAAVVVAAVAVAKTMLRRAASARYERQLPIALEAIARSLRSRVSLLRAIEEASGVVTGRIAGDLGAVVRRAQHGVGLAETLEEWGRTSSQFPGVRLAVTALVLGSETGGAQAKAVDGVAATLRERTVVMSEARALASQARLSAVVLVTAPLAFCTFQILTSRDTADFLLRSPAGIACLGVGLTLDAVGGAWMAVIARGSQ